MGCVTICSFMQGFNLHDSLAATSFWFPQCHTVWWFLQGTLFPFLAFPSALEWHLIASIPSGHSKDERASISRGTFPFKWGLIQILLSSLTSGLQSGVIQLRESPCSPDSFFTHLNSQYVNRYFTKSWRISLKIRHSWVYQVYFLGHARTSLKDARHAQISGN